MNTNPTPQSKHLLAEADAAAREIDNGLLAFASAEAQFEWQELRSRWPSADSSDELAFVVDKIQRFRTILRIRQSDARVVPEAQQ